MNLIMVTMALNLFYSELVSMLLNSAKEGIPSYTFNPHTKPYWNSDVKIAHKIERGIYQVWLHEGMPRLNTKSVLI